jgi:hypothetical protein
MEKHIIINILQDLDIKDTNDVKTRILEIDKSVAGNLLNKMDEWYQNQKIQMQETSVAGDSIYDIWVPSTNESGINKVASNFLFANRLTLSDPLYDYLCHLERDSSVRYDLLSKEMRKYKGLDRKEHTCADCMRQLDPIFEKYFKAKLESILTFYIRSKPLIESGQLIPYVDTSPRERPILDTPIVETLRKYDKEFDNFVSKIESTRDHFYQMTGEGHLVNEISKPYLPQYIDFVVLEWTALTGIDEVLSTNFVQSPSIDFLGHTSYKMFSAFYRFLQKSQKVEARKVFLNPFSTHHFSLPTLSGIDIREIPEILYKERDAFEQFKISLQFKVMGISSPYGSPDWQGEIEKLKIQIQHDLIECQRTMDHIRNAYSQKQAANVSFMAFSIGIASLALVQQSIDPLTAFQSVAGAAGLSSSLKNIIENWLDYRSEVNEQKRKDIYFLWRLGSLKKKAG